MISDCCGAEDRIATLDRNLDDVYYSDINMCPECKDFCVFISEEEFGNEYAKEQQINALTGDEL